MGKTSVVLESLNERKKTRHMLVNCWGKTSLGGFVEAIYEAFLSYQNPEGSVLGKDNADVYSFTSHGFRRSTIGETEFYHQLV